jgi:hypothetical protein
MSLGKRCGRWAVAAALLASSAVSHAAEVGVSTRALLATLSLPTLPSSPRAPALPGLSELLNRFEMEKPALGNTRYVALLNYRQPSWEPRFYIIDPATTAVIGSYRVAHGKGSDLDHDGYAEQFSDEEQSLMSSVGYFVTRDSYLSETENHGLSLRLDGLSETNRHAMERKIVVHGNLYMQQDFLEKHGVPGRSWGCMVFSPSDRDEIVSKLEGGALIYAYY